MDSFYSFVNSGEYLALPLLILFILIVFAIFWRLTYAALALLAEIKPKKVKEFLKKVNAKTKITERIIEIVKGLVDIVLDSIITALDFVTLIPDLFVTLYSFVSKDEGEFELDDESEAEDCSA